MSNFPDFYNTLNGIHLIEISPELSKLQFKRLNEFRENNTESTNYKFYWHNTINDILGKKYNLFFLQIYIYIRFKN